ncbi:MAG: ABC transporter ATP-binding protein [Sphingopyxis sp.]
MADLVVESLCVSAGAQELVKGASFSASPGEMLVIIGPNGAGKSSLLQAIIGIGPKIDGVAKVGSQALSKMRPTDRARLVGWLPQIVPQTWPITVRDSVALGRFPHGSHPDRPSSEDRRAVDEAMAKCALEPLAHRTMPSLSGGEIARVHIARTLASGAPILLVDEPVAALDPRHALTIMQSLRNHANSSGIVVAILHDMGLAARFADRILGMRDGGLLFDLAPAQAITPGNIATLFDVTALVENGAGWPQPTILAQINEGGGQRG